MSVQAVNKCFGCSVKIPPSRGGRARKWCSERCRKLTLYSRRCVDCDAVCNTDGRVTRAAERCRTCAERLTHETRTWTPEAIVAAIQSWADEHGGVPPTASEWRYGADHDPAFPYPPCVLREFGTWNAAISLAGFDTFKSGHYGREGEDPAVVAETIQLYRSGLSCAAVGERLGVSGAAILHRLEVAGEPRRAPGRRRAA
jgi:hypothetical protein